MLIEWVNHASFVAAHGTTRLLTDPWFEGRAFNESWSLLSPTRFRYEDFSTITHIWFSHEHPDHFSPPTLKHISPEVRAKTTVLYQTTIDRKIVRFCQGLRFESVREIIPHVNFFLNQDVRLLLGKMRNETDSWLLIDMGGHRLLNMNDCVPDAAGLDRIRRIVGPVDVLLTQFSYANWVGNPGDSAALSRAADNKLAEMKRQIAAFQPRFVVPCASFVWFSNRDNFFMNAGVNRVETAARVVEASGATPVVLYPGDEWQVGAEWHNEEALARYENDRIARVHLDETFAYPVVTIEALMNSADRYRADSLRVNAAGKLNSFGTFTAHVSDLGTSISFSFAAGPRVTRKDPEECDVVLPGAALQYCFDHSWGFGTLEVSGAFRKPERGEFERIREYEWISSLNNRGRRTPGVMARVLRRLGIHGFDVIKPSYKLTASTAPEP
jgi:UDP-MurNAc hydroxylase